MTIVCLYFIKSKPQLLKVAIITVYSLLFYIPFNQSFYIDNLVAVIIEMPAKLTKLYIRTIDTDLAGPADT